jgi:hypothetical protein
MSLKHFRKIGTAVAASIALVGSACSLARQSTQQTNVPNLIGIFVVTKDNLTNTYKGEVYPLALIVNDRYINVSDDVTLAVRNQSEPDRILKIEAPNSFLTAIKKFAVTHQNQPQGTFTVDRLAVTSYVCSSLMTGQGSYQGNDLSALFERIPESLGGRFRQVTAGAQPFDETRRFAIATSQAPSTAGSTIPQADPEKYRQDLVAKANDLFSQDPRVKDLPGETTVENLSVVDLNRDGVPEVLGSVIKKVAANSDAARQQARTGKQAAATLWLTYDRSQPVVLSSDIRQQVDARSLSELVGTLDLDGDGIEEAILQDKGYESTSFSIYEYKNNQLTQVFSGAGFGC